MEKLSIGILHYSCPPVIGGVEEVIENHALLLRRYGFPVKVVVGKGEEFNEDIPVEVVPEISSTYQHNAQVQKRLKRKKPTKQSLRLFAEYKMDIKEKLLEALEGVDLLFIHNILSMHFNLALSAAMIEIIKEKKLSCRYISWCHDHTFIDPDYAEVSIDFYPWNVIRELVPQVQYITISPERNKRLAKLFNVKLNDIPVVPNGIYFNDFLQLDKRTEEIITRYRLLDQDVIFFAPTRIVPRKNIELSIKVTAAFKRMFRLKTKLIVTGPPDPHNPESMKYYRRLKKLAKEEGCTRDIIFLYEHFVAKGFRLKVTMLIIRDLYLISGCLLFPSFSEGFGIPILEAGLLKRPVVCSDIPSHAMIGGDDVLKINPLGNPEKIANKIMVFLHRDITRPLFKRVMKRYTWRRIFREKILPLIHNDNLKREN
jgi:glycosyltransferase involved in cell wall biosynthesis